MRLSQFIKDNLESTLEEWECFARSLVPPAGALSQIALRDHARELLLAIALDIESAQTENERSTKSQGHGTQPIESAASTVHGALRQVDGFSLTQVTAEFRALRATVLKRWKATLTVEDAGVVEEIMRFNESIDQALIESVAAYSEKVERSRDTFLAVLGHDLRGPLQTLSGCLELLGGAGATPERIAKYTQIGKRGVIEIQKLIADLLEYTRTRLGKGIDVAPAHGNLSILCQETLDEVQVAYPSQNLTARIDSDVECAIDAARIRQVLNNLISNAMQHGDPETPIELSLRQQDAQVRLSVKNYGVPIPPEAMRIIFNPLVQLARKDSIRGVRNTNMGFGLYIVREIASGHGGTIEVSSSAEQGTVFTVCLPSAPAAPVGLI
jgi:signal transduction histidine kinase